MATKKIQKPGTSQVAPPSKGGKISSPKDQILPSKDIAPSTKAAKSPPTVAGHVPNDETAEVLRQAQDGKNLHHYESLEEMFEDLGI